MVVGFKADPKPCGLVVSVYQEYTDTPITWANNEESGSIYIYSAMERDGEWVQDHLVHIAWTDPEELEGTAVLNGTVWTYTEHGETMWGMKFDTATNQWTFNTSGKYASPTGKYIIRAHFYSYSLTTYYPRNYKGEPKVPVEPGTYVMTVPYYKVTYTTDINEPYPYQDKVRFGDEYNRAVDGAYKTAIMTVQTTVPVKMSAGLNFTGIPQTTNIWVNEWSEPEFYYEDDEQKWRCGLRSAQLVEILDLDSLPYYGYGNISSGSTTCSIDLQLFNGESTADYALTSSKWMEWDQSSGWSGNTDYTGTLPLGWTYFWTDWINPPAPVTREGLPSSRGIRETTAYLKLTYNELTGIPWYASYPRHEISCGGNTFETWSSSMHLTPNILVKYSE
ncbi:MAG: hypothetical protein PHF65_07800 [Oscillospiraceae bacterium]|nr:hypothetical protein [Oscillospiraceae bacterium]